MNKKLSHTLSIIVWSLFFVMMGLTYYVNHHLPHGQMYPTGDPSCITEDRGCSEGYAEDMSNLNIPDWAKYIRKYFIIHLVGLGILGIFLSNKKED